MGWEGEIFPRIVCYPTVSAPGQSSEGTAPYPGTAIAPPLGRNRGSPSPTALQAASEAARKSQAMEGWNKIPVTLGGKERAGLRGVVTFNSSRFWWAPRSVCRHSLQLENPLAASGWVLSLCCFLRGRHPPHSPKKGLLLPVPTPGFAPGTTSCPGALSAAEYKAKIAFIQKCGESPEDEGLSDCSWCTPYMNAPRDSVWG